MNRIKGRGATAQGVVSEALNENLTGFIGEGSKDKRALLKAIRKEFKGVPGTGARNDVLSGLTSGTYPSEAIADRQRAATLAKRRELETRLTGDRTLGDTEGSRAATEGSLPGTDKEEESDEGSGTDDEVEEVRLSDSSDPKRSMKKVLSMLRDMQASQQKLRRDVQKLKTKRRDTSKGRSELDLMKELRAAIGGGPPPDDDDSPSESDWEDDEYRRERRREGTGKRRENERFWATVADQPFLEQTLLVDTLEGEMKLRKALTNYPTVSAWVEARQLGALRNKREAATLGKLLDCIISSIGVLRAKNELAVEVSLRRLTAVLMADKTGNWDAVRQLEEDHEDLISKSMRRKLHKSAKLRKELASSKKSKSALRKQGDGDA